MFGIFNKKQKTQQQINTSRREEVRKYTENLFSLLYASDIAKQKAVGQAINMANSAFMQRFGSQNEFCNQPVTVRIDYIKSLNLFENQLLNKDPEVALGFGLFKMWIAFLSDNDDELIEKFAKDLEYFSSKAAF